jgi:hypothetical protein
MGPHENVEVMLRAFQAFEQGGFEAAAAFMHDDFEMSQLPGRNDSEQQRAPSRIWAHAPVISTERVTSGGPSSWQSQATVRQARVGLIHP